jgi:hypothetical protein
VINYQPQSTTYLPAECTRILDGLIDEYRYDA